ncbi:hypothetical protein BGZ67_005233 [Mortierella alpina]|nr:hypothetical protein BGZ67_005233 [Mortierella alpina]
MSHHRWELFPLGNIPHEVLSILLGSLPKVPDPKQEVEALERQYATHDDRLSDDDDEDDDVEDTRTDTTLPDQDLSLQQQQQRERTGPPKDSRSAKSGQQQPNDDDDDEDAQRSWNVPDEEWEWSDEESSTLNSSKPSRTAKQGVTLSAPSRMQEQHQRHSRSGLGISDSVVGRRLSSGPTRLGSSSSSTSTSSRSSSPNVTPQIHRNDNPALAVVAAAASSHPLSVAQDLCVSVCDSGRYIACASKKMFAILQRQTHRSSASTLPVQDRRLGQGQGSPREAQEWVLVGQGSGVESTLDAITTILCLPLYVPRSHQSQVYVVIGYKSGMIRIFNEAAYH